jgi:hypothetical protein
LIEHDSPAPLETVDLTNVTFDLVTEPGSVIVAGTVNIRGVAVNLVKQTLDDPPVDIPNVFVLDTDPDMRLLITSDGRVTADVTEANRQACWWLAWWDGADLNVYRAPA